MTAFRESEWGSVTWINSCMMMSQSLDFHQQSLDFHQQRWLTVTKLQLWISMWNTVKGRVSVHQISLPFIPWPTMQSAEQVRVKTIFRCYFMTEFPSESWKFKSSKVTDITYWESELRLLRLTLNLPWSNVIKKKLVYLVPSNLM